MNRTKSNTPRKNVNAVNNLATTEDIVNDKRERAMVITVAGVGVVASICSAGILAPPSILATLGFYGKHKWNQHKRQQNHENEKSHTLDI